MEMFVDEAGPCSWASRRTACDPCRGQTCGAPSRSRRFSPRTSFSRQGRNPAVGSASRQTTRLLGYCTSACLLLMSGRSASERILLPSATVRSTTNAQRQAEDAARHRRQQHILALDVPMNDGPSHYFEYLVRSFLPGARSRLYRLLR